MSGPRNAPTTLPLTVGIVSSVFPPLGRVGASIRLVKFLQYLDPTKWRFDVITPAPGFTVLPIESEASSLLACLPANIEVHRRKAILRLPHRLAQKRQLPTLSQPEGEKRLSIGTLVHGLLRYVKRIVLLPDEDLLWVFSVLPYAFAWGRRTKMALIYACGPQYSVLLLGVFVALLRRTPLVVDLRDDWYENAKRSRKPKPVVAIEMAIEKMILCYASKVIAPTSHGVDAIRRRHRNLTGEQVVCVPNGFDAAEFQSTARTFEVRDTRPFTIVCGSGGLTPGYRDLRSFIEALWELCKRNSTMSHEIEVVFLGFDVQKYYGNILKHNGLERMVRQIRHLTRDEYVAQLFQADLLLLVQMDDAPSSLPGTLYEYAAVNSVPVFLVGGEGATRDFVQQCGLGYAFGIREIGAMAECLAELYRQWHGGTPVTCRRNMDLAEFDRRLIANRFSKVLESACFGGQLSGGG